MNRSRSASHSESESQAVTRRDFIARAGGAVAAAWAGGLAHGQGTAPAAKPNIVVILADDLGYGDLSYQGCRDLSTPNIDSIAAEGVKFTDGYVSCSICSPTRAGIMTGRYQNRFGHETNPVATDPAVREKGMPTTEVTIAGALRSAGYATGIVGKWHLGMRPECHPLSRGFDESFGFLHGGHSYLDAKRGVEADPLRRGRDPVAWSGYLTDVFTQEACAFIDKHRHEPFFLYLPYNAVHTPLEAIEKYLARFGSVEDTTRRTYLAMTSALDDGVGAVLARLKETGLERNTVVFFLSDNGGYLPSTARNAPLRAGKASYYEGGIRIPFCVKWPGTIPRGQVFSRPVISLDIPVTAASIAGAQMPEDRAIDGVNILPYITGGKSGAPHDILYWRMFSRHAVRKGDWKLVRQGEKDELFDLSQDIGETTDLAASKPQVLAELAEAYRAWDAQMVEPLWVPDVSTRLRSRAKRGVK